MKKVPDIISTKDLSYIEDMFNWHFCLCKKCETYSSLTEDETISEYFLEIKKRHEKICQKLIKILEEAC